MTIEEAAATLGLAPHEVAPEAVERNYRLKAKQCHPDRASYPGAAAEFKRATEAYGRLKQPAKYVTEPTHPQVNSKLAQAAESFFFIAAYAKPEPWLHMGWAEWLASLVGTQSLQLQSSGRTRKGDALVKLVSWNNNASARPLLVAPVDVEVLEFQSKTFCRLWLLRPLETQQVRRRLELFMAEGLGLEAAIERLRDELFEAARLPLSV